MTCANVAVIAAFGLDNLLVGGNNVLVIALMGKLDPWGTPILARGVAMLAVAILFFAWRLRVARRRRTAAEARRVKPKPRLAAAIAARRARRLAKRLLLYWEMKKSRVPESVIEHQRQLIELAIRELPAEQALSVMAASRADLGRLDGDAGCRR
jgi:hypothetical protein